MPFTIKKVSGQKRSFKRGTERVPFRRSHLFSLKWLLAPSRDVFVSSELPTQLSPSKQQLIGPFTKWSVLIGRRIFIFLNNFLSKNTYFEALVLFHRYMMYYYTMFFKNLILSTPIELKFLARKLKICKKWRNFGVESFGLGTLPLQSKKYQRPQNWIIILATKIFKGQKIVFSLEIENSLENFSKVPVIWNMNYSFSDT